MDQPSDVIMKFISEAQDDFDAQEFFDKDHQIYLNIRKTAVVNDDETYYCYSFTDVSE